jgi:hypothetical protein
MALKGGGKLFSKKIYKETQSIIFTTKNYNFFTISAIILQNKTHLKVTFFINFEKNQYFLLNYYNLEHGQNFV